MALSQLLLQTLQAQPAAEQTPAVLPGKSHQSPSRQQRVADPRRESTALFKGFSASTAESGLLEVEEIAEINGSPELVRAPHGSMPIAQPEQPPSPAVSASEATLPLRQSPHAAAFQQEDSPAQSAEGLHHHSQQQRESDAQNMYAEDVSSATFVDANVEQRELGRSSHMPASELGPGLISPRPQSLQDASISAADRATSDAGVAGKPLTRQVCASVSSDLLLHLACVSILSAKPCLQFSSALAAFCACCASKLLMTQIIQTHIWTKQASLSSSQLDSGQHNHSKD